MRTKGLDFFSDPTWPADYLPEEPLKLESQSPQELLQMKSSKLQRSYAQEINAQEWYSLEITPRKPSMNCSLDQIFKQQEEDLSILQRQASLQYSRFLNKIQPSNSQLPKQEEEDNARQQDQSDGEESLKRNKNKNLFRLKKKYNILDQQTKQFLVSQVQLTSVSTVSKQYGVSVNSLTRWINSCARKKGAGRKVYDADLEEKLKNWIASQLSKDGGLGLSRDLIKQKAKLWSSIPQFLASKGWLERFVVRNKVFKLESLLEMNLKGTNTPKQIIKEETIEKQIAGDNGGRRCSQRVKSRRDILIKKTQQDGE